MNQPAPHRRLRAGLGLALAGVALLAWLLWPGPPAQARSAAAAPPPAPAVASVTPVPPPAPAPASTAGAPAAAAPAPRGPVIDGIDVEKPVVCSGEDNLVTVHAHAADGADGDLHATIGQHLGMQALVRVELKPDGTAEMPLVRVFGRDNAATDARVPEFRVEKCPARPVVVIGARQLPNAESRFELTARVFTPDPAAPAFKPTSYLWTFEGGGELRTELPRVERELTPSPDRLYSSVLVKVSVEAEDGRRLEGRTALTVTSKAYQNLSQRGVVMISTSATPAFPQLGEDGVVRQVLHLRHAYRKVVRVTAVFETDEVSATQPNEPQPPPTRKPASLSIGEIRPGSVVDVSLALDPAKEPGVFSRTYEFEGAAEDGTPAKGSFALMRPPPMPTKEHHVPVTDADLTRRILLARKILGRRYVTDEDLYRLQAEGKLDQR